MAKILLVEDDEMSWDMLSRRLQRKGYEVVVAIWRKGLGNSPVGIAQAHTNGHKLTRDGRLGSNEADQGVARNSVNSHHRSDRSCHVRGSEESDGGGL